MGRPLFSHTYAYTAPAVQVREEPEQQPQLERWSYLNQFDPDSEEFFANAEDEWVRAPEAGELARGEEVDRGMVEEVDSSDASSSGRGTPTQDDDGLSVEELELEHRRRVSSREGRPADDDGQTYRGAQLNSRPATSYMRTSHYQGPSRSPSPSVVRAPMPRSQVQPEPVTARSNPIPIPAPARPSTPPNTTSYSFGSPSPPPSVTPRLYNWATRSALPPVASPGSPLPNRGARRSVAHIASSPVARFVF